VTHPIYQGRRPAGIHPASLLGLTVAALVALAGCTAATPTPAPTAARSVPATSGPSTKPALATASPVITASPSPRPPSPAQTYPTAQVTFNELMLDSSTDAAARPRSFSFTSDGSGTVSIQVVSGTTNSSVKLCLTIDATAQQCRTGLAPSFTDEATTTAHSKWLVTLAAADEGTPTVDLSLSWPSEHPSVTETDGRFQGSPNPDALRSLTVTFKTRIAGQASLQAAWTPGTAGATLTLAKEPVSGSSVYTIKYTPATSLTPDFAHAVDPASNYRLTLMNDSSNTARTSLTATLTFP
jgi:hypothetical protein